MSASARARFVALLVTCLPVVAAAQGPAPTPTPATAEPKAELRAQEVRPNLQVLTGPAGNIAVWASAEGVVLVDDGTAALTPQLLEAVGRLSREPIRFVINTHWHPDHTGGNEALAKSGAIVIAQEGVRERMMSPQVVEEYDTRVAAAPAGALPVITFPDTLSLHLGGERLNLVHVANSHTDSDVIVRWQEANVVHMGDIFYNGGYPFIDLASGGSLAGMVAALEGTLARMDADTVVIPGHGPVATRAELAAYRDMLVTIGRKVREQVEAGSSVDEVLALHLSAAYDERYGHGAVNPERFIRTLYRDLTRPRSAR